VTTAVPAVKARVLNERLQQCRSRFRMKPLWAIARRSIAAPGGTALCRAKNPVDGGANCTTLNHMVNFQSPTLDRTFAALSDPTRRALLTRLAEQPDLSVSALAEPFPVSLPAIMKHLDVLSDAGLVTRSKTGRTVACRLRPTPMLDAIEWLNRYERFWSERLDRLATFLEQEDPCPPTRLPRSASPASPSSAASRRHRPKSSAPGRTRKK
jgi:DNA-binding transcriptional ArsR family regulator